MFTHTSSLVFGRAHGAFGSTRISLAALVFSLGAAS